MKSACFAPSLRRRLAVCALLLPLLVSCGRAVNRTAERRIRDLLPDLIGPARQYRVHVDNAPERTLRGRLANVLIDGDDVQLANGLLLDQLHLELKGVEVDTRHGSVRTIREAQFAATVGEKSLDVFLAGEAPEGETIRHTQVTLEAGNRVTISAERMTLGLGVPFHLTGPLRLAGPRRFEVDPTRLVVVGIPITGALLRFLKDRFETALDLTSLPFPVQLTAVQTGPGKLTISGTADVAAILKRTQKEPK